jgi:hypothetical protein
MEVFMSMSDVQEEEVKQLKKLLDERRAAGIRGAYPAEMRRRIVILSRNGVPIRVLAKRLGIATSMLYGWGKKEKDATPAHETAAHVMRIEPDSVVRETAAAGELRLQMGRFAITVSLAGV